MTKDEVKAEVRAYIAAQFLAGESPDSLKDDTKLVTNGILDSLASLKLVSWLEERFGIGVEAHEVDVEHLETLDLIAGLVMSKRGK